MAAFGEAAGRDLADWTHAWLDRAGTDVLSLDGAELAATSPDGGAPRPHRLDIASYAVEGGTLAATGTTSVELSGERASLDLPAGDLRLVNADDLTFAAVRPDERSRRLMLEHVADLPDPLSRALVLGTASQLLLLGELAPRDAARATTRALARESSPALVERAPDHGRCSSRTGWAPADETPGLLARARRRRDGADRRRRAPAAGAARPRRRRRPPRSTGGCSTRPRRRPGDNDLAWRIAVRRAELGDYDADAVQRLLDSDPDPDAATRRLIVLAARPDLEAKEEVWDAFFVHYTVPASRETLVLGRDLLAPGQAELLAPFAIATSRSCTTLKGGLLNQGLAIRAMYPLGVGDESFLAAAEGRVRRPER